MEPDLPRLDALIDRLFGLARSEPADGPEAVLRRRRRAVRRALRREVDSAIAEHAAGAGRASLRRFVHAELARFFSAAAGESGRDEPVVPPLEPDRHHTGDAGRPFVHRDRRGRLEQALDRYLQERVFPLDAAGLPPAALARAARRARAVRAAGRRLIAELAAVEDCRLAVFERRKRIKRSRCCLTADRLPRQLLDAVAASAEQWKEWAAAGLADPAAGVEDPRERRRLRRAELLGRPELVVDTRHLGREFHDRLLSSFERLDRAVDGVAVRGENLAALALLRPCLAGAVRCIYVDPPFNTETDRFLYPDDLAAASWVALVDGRVRLARELLADDGTLWVHVDPNSSHLARLVLDRRFGRQALLNEVVWRIGWVSGYKTAGRRFVRNHDTLYAYVKTPGGHFFAKERARIPYTAFDAAGVAGALREIRRAWGLADDPRLRLKLAYKDPAGRVYKLGLLAKQGSYAVEDTWNASEYEDLHSNKIKRNAAEYTPNGARLTQKPEQLLRRILEVSSAPGDLVLDFFAGSGTTPAVAHKLGRRWVAVERGEWFETDLVTRLKAVLAGRPVGISRAVGHRAGGMFRCLELESYEEAMARLARARPRRGTGGLPSAILAAALADSGQLPGDGELARPLSSGAAFDLPETFAWLLGLTVRSRCTVRDGKRRYLVQRGQASGREVAVVWRDVVGWKAADFARERRFAARSGLVDGAEQVWINVTSTIPGARSLDGELRARMTAPLGRDAAAGR